MHEEEEKNKVRMLAYGLSLYSYIHSFSVQLLPFIIRCSRDADSKKTNKTNETRTPLTLPLQNLQNSVGKTINKGINIHKNTEYGSCPFTEEKTHHSPKA